MELNMGRKQCSNPTCKKRRVLDNLYCQKCLDKQEMENDPHHGLPRLTEVEAERWGRLDAEIRNYLLSQKLKQAELQILEYQEKERQQRHALVLAQKNNEIEELRQRVLVARQEYDKLTDSFAAKYNISKTKMVIDPDTRVIRELD